MAAQRPWMPHQAELAGFVVVGCLGLLLRHMVVYGIKTRNGICSKTAGMTAIQGGGKATANRRWSCDADTPPITNRPAVRIQRTSALRTTRPGLVA